MTAKVYARKADNNDKSGKNIIHSTSWVVHPAKPGKVCVVIDCSAEYRGTSLNNQLISGPDLTNQVVGVLTTFREKQVIFNADVDAMFHQVSVPEDQRSLLRFWWWENRDTRNPIKDHEMFVIYFKALRRTSVDNGEEFGTDAARTLRKICIDDMLSSRETGQAADLIHQISNTCKAGEFNSTKFINNKTDVMKSAPEEHCRKNINIKELES